MISGLLTCKPKNTPQVGQIKNMIWEEIVSERTGNTYTKVKFAAPDKGGKPCQIISVESTGYTDSHQNVSFNVDFQPVDATGVPALPANHPNVSQTPPQSSGTPPVQRSVQPVESWQQHLAKAAFLLNKCHDASENYGMEDGEDARSLFIWATREGLVSQMPKINLEDGTEEK